MNTILPTTKHAAQRMNERGIAPWMIREVVLNGIYIQKQGLLYHYIGRKQMPHYLSEPERNILENLVVVESRDGMIITTYKKKGALKALKKKQKHLCRAA